MWQIIYCHFNCVFKMIMCTFPGVNRLFSILGTSLIKTQLKLLMTRYSSFSSNCFNSSQKICTSSYRLDPARPTAVIKGKKPKQKNTYIDFATPKSGTLIWSQRVVFSSFFYWSEKAVTEVTASRLVIAALWLPFKWEIEKRKPLEPG